MWVEYGRMIGIAAGTLLTLWIAVRVMHSARRLNAGVQAAKEEQEKQAGVVDPYAAMAEMYTATPKAPPTWKEDKRKRD